MLECLEFFARWGLFDDFRLNIIFEEFIFVIEFFLHLVWLGLSGSGRVEFRNDVSDSFLIIVLIDD